MISSSGSLAEINPLRYRGYYYDTETGMYYLQSRYYDPSLKRFINADDAELIADLALESVLGGNIFAYCENNAVNASDPEGYWASSKHEEVTLATGFNKNIAAWAKKADGTGFASNSEYSAPFHSRLNALSIAKELFNTAMKLKTNYSSKVTFCFDKSGCNKKGHYRLSSLLYYKLKPDGQYTASNSGSLNFLKALNKLTSIKAQYEALFGLALHTIQDYFAHVLNMSMDIYKRKNSRQVFTYQKKYSNIITFVDEEMTKYGFKRCSLEDDTGAFPWRFECAKKVTKLLYSNYYRKNKKINSISAQQLPSFNNSLTRTKNLYKLVFWMYDSTIKIDGKMVG